EGRRVVVDVERIGATAAVDGDGAGQQVEVAVADVDDIVAVAGVDGQIGAVTADVVGDDSAGAGGTVHGQVLDVGVVNLAGENPSEGAGVEGVRVVVEVVLVEGGDRVRPATAVEVQGALDVVQELAGRRQVEGVVASAGVDRQFGAEQIALDVIDRAD